MGTFVENVNTLATNLTAEVLLDIGIVTTNIDEILLADDNALIATAKAGEATASAVDALASKVAAAASALAAVGSASAASASEIAAEASALSAAVDATTATTKAGEALISAANALSSEQSAEGSAANALASEQSAASLLDQFDDRYLGPKVVEPTLDNDGNALLVGALYFDSVVNRMRVYGSDLAWSDALILTTASISTMTNKTLDNITNQVGADHVHYKVRNNTGTIIPIGTVVMASGTQPGTDYINVLPVTDLTHIALGVTHTALAINGSGLVINTGVIDDFNTDAWIVGTVLYPNTSGGFTTVKPTTGQFQACAYVLRQHSTQGTLLVEFTNPEYIASTTQEGYVRLNDTLISTSTVQALTAAQGKVLQDSTEKLSNKGAVNGYAPLDASQKVPAANLPSYVDDVLEYTTKAALPVTGATGIIYVVVADESAGGDTSSYRWTGSVYAMVSNTLTAGDIKTLYESNANTNEFSDTEQTSLAKLLTSAVTSVTFNADGSITIVTP